ncbi:hypothetical protein AA309_08720 [Microvirga vignae]|uniref:Right handed beta helix domain-containing protein n=1 Tax=Microvirga vignae TaxID=1225564 RepID=A0A0H1REA6_9HYPH|nr:right-handed parallel beta-helix repeat-containing protein [Microvirga vignae]KLK93404.1 hypothetical protein AA309_08720 [Microvirga vignae]
MYLLQAVQPTDVIWVSAGGRTGGAGTETDPVKTIQEAVNRAKPGTAVMVKAGVYTENVTLRTNGAQDLPIQIISADGRGKAQIKPADNAKDTLQVAGVDHIVIDGMSIAGPTSASRNAVHVYVNLNNTFDPPKNIVLKNNDIAALAGDGIKVSKAEYVYVLNNRITGSTGEEEGIDFVGVHHGVIGHNEIKGAHGAAINIKGGSYDILVEGNHIDGAGKHGIGVGGYTGEEFFWPGFIGTESYEARDIRVVGNEVENTAHQGIRVLGAQSVELTGNWIHDIVHTKAIGVSAAGSTFHTPAWESKDVTLQGNWLDKTDWLGLASALDSTKLISNYAGSTGPSVWEGVGVTPYYETSGSVQTDETEDSQTPSPSSSIPPSTIDQSSWIKGGSGADVLKGNNSANIIWGAGGHDSLTGGSGADTFVFSEAKAASSDTILDFSNSADRIGIMAAGFGLREGAGLRNGDLEASYFKTVSGTSKQGSALGHGQFLYNKTSYKLMWDSDGAGAAEAALLATFKKGVLLTADHFMIVA